MALSQPRGEVSQIVQKQRESGKQTSEYDRSLHGARVPPMNGGEGGAHAGSGGVGINHGGAFSKLVRPYEWVIAMSASNNFFVTP
jgi:hypothetical protein